MPDSGLSTLMRSSAAQEYWVKRLLAYVIDAIIVYAVIGLIVAATVIPAFIMGVFVPGSSPRVPFGGFFGTVRRPPSWSSTSPSPRRPTERPSERW